MPSGFFSGMAVDLPCVVFGEDCAKALVDAIPEAVIAKATAGIAMSDLMERCMDVDRMMITCLVLTEQSCHLNQKAGHF